MLSFACIQSKNEEFLNLGQSQMELSLNSKEYLDMFEFKSIQGLSAFYKTTLSVSMLR